MIKFNGENQDILRFEEIMSEIESLANEAVELIPRGTPAEARARSYWFPTITGCIDGRATMTTMDETLQEMKELVVEELLQKLENDNNG